MLSTYASPTHGLEEQTRKKKIIIIIMVIFKCYFSGELIAKKKITYGSGCNESESDFCDNNNWNSRSLILEKCQGDYMEVAELSRGS